MNDPNVQAALMTFLLALLGLLTAVVAAITPKVRTWLDAEATKASNAGHATEVEITRDLASTAVRFVEQWLKGSNQGAKRDAAIEWLYSKNMLPCLALANQPNRADRNRIVRGDGSQRFFLVIPRSNHTYIFGSQSGLRMIAATIQRLPAFRDHVLHVVRSRAYEQMLRVKASRGVAFVADIQVGIDVESEECCRSGAMNEDALPANRDPSVSASDGFASPQPASTLRINFPTGHEAGGDIFPAIDRPLAVTRSRTEPGATYRDVRRFSLKRCTAIFTRPINQATGILVGHGRSLLSCTAGLVSSPLPGFFMSAFSRPQANFTMIGGDG